MKSVLVSGEKGQLVEAKIENIEVPTPKENEVLIKVVVSGSNPKDWKVPVFAGKTHNPGDDIAGIVHSVGSSVTAFKPGDRVAAFHPMTTPSGSYAEYAISPDHTIFHLPEKASFEDAATYPLAAMTSAIGLFLKLGLPTPLKPAEEGEEIPLLIYGGSTAVGAFAIKLAKLAKIGPIIAVAGGGGEFAKSVGADIVVDYRKGNVVEDIKAALGGKQLNYIYDTISEGDSIPHSLAVLQPTTGHYTYVLPVDTPSLSSFHHARTYVGIVHDGQPFERDFGYAYYTLFGKWWGEGKFGPHPYEVVEGGLEGVGEALRRLQRGEVSAKKLVFRIEDTPGLKA